MSITIQSLDELLLLNTEAGSGLLRVIDNKYKEGMIIFKMSKLLCISNVTQQSYRGSSHGKVMGGSLWNVL